MSAACLPPINVTLKTISSPCPTDRGSQNACYNNNDIPTPSCNPCPTDFCSVGNRCPDGNEVEIVVGLKKKFEPVYKPPAFPIDGRTTYKHNYVAYPLGFTKVLPIKPMGKNTLPRVFQQINDCKTEDVTWYKYQFPPHKIEPYKAPNWARRTAIIPHPGPMFSMTTYSQAYEPKQGTPSESAKPKHKYLAQKEEMDCLTSYQAAYHAWCMEPTNMIKPHNRPGWVNDCCVPFRGLSTYKGDYRGGYEKPRVSYKPKYTPAPGGFPYISTYRAAYEPYYFKTKPCIPGPTYDNMFRS